jgi:hypothetical protein
MVKVDTIDRDRARSVANAVTLIVDAPLAVLAIVATIAQAIGAWHVLSRPR